MSAVTWIDIPDYAEALRLGRRAHWREAAE
jgi:hypothetical protein